MLIIYINLSMTITMKAIHESLANITPADRFFGCYHEIMDRRAMIKIET